MRARGKKATTPRVRLPLTKAVRPFVSFKEGVRMLAQAEREVNGLMFAHGPMAGILRDDSGGIEAFREALARVVAAGGFNLEEADRIINQHEDAREWDTLVQNYSTREEAGFFIGLCVGARLGGFR